MKYQIEKKKIYAAQQYPNEIRAEQKPIVAFVGPNKARLLGPGHARHSSSRESPSNKERLSGLEANRRPYGT